MVKNILLLFTLFWVTACGYKVKQKEVDVENSKFSTSQASVLFFNNVRQIFYDKQQIAPAKMNIYRFSDRSKAEDHPVLNLAIANNWLHDEAYILVEPNSFFNDPAQIEIVWTDTLTQEQGKYTFTFGNKNNHFRFAGQLHHSILNSHKLQVLEQDSTLTDLLQLPKEREAFRHTMVDYYRLVELD